MAEAIHRAIPDKELQNRYRNLKILLRAAAAGFGTSVTTNLFNDDWVESLGIGLSATAITAMLDYLRERPKLRDDALAVRRQVLHFIEIFPRLLGGHLTWKEGAKRNTADGLAGTREVLAAVTRGDAVILSIPFESEFLTRVEKMLENARQSADTELVILLIDLQTAILSNVARIPDVLNLLMFAVADEKELAGTYDLTAEVLERPPVKEVRSDERRVLGDSSGLTEAPNLKSPTRRMSPKLSD
jgi:hypothetical protein